MFVHLQDFDQLNLARHALDVNRPASAVEPDGALSLALTL